MDDHGDGGGRRPRTGKERKSPARAREPGIERESSAPRASRGERPHRAHRFASTACVCRSTSVRRRASIDSNHPIEESRSSRPTSPRVPLNSFSSPSPLDARALAVCRLFSRAFRSSRSSVPSASPSVVFPVSRVVLPPSSSSSSSPRLVFESRARSLSRHRDFHSFVWVDEVLGFTSHDSRMYPCANNHEL